jgi:hypothetical protein
MSTQAQTSIAEIFPKEIEISVTFKIPVADAEDKAYFLSADGTVSPSFLADIYDFADDGLSIGITSLNNLTYHEIKAALNAAAGLEAAASITTGPTAWRPKP